MAANPSSASVPWRPTTPPEKPPAGGPMSEKRTAAPVTPPKSSPMAPEKKPKVVPLPLLQREIGNLRNQFEVMVETCNKIEHLLEEMQPQEAVSLLMETENQELSLSFKSFCLFCILGLPVFAIYFFLCRRDLPRS